MAEVNVESPAIGRRGRAGMTVLCVRRRRFGRILDKHLALPDDLAGLTIDCNGLQRVSLTLLDRSGEVYAALPDDRRRPATAGDRRLPGDVLVRAPFSRNWRADVM